jgi:hypothetical protein
LKVFCGSFWESSKNAENEASIVKIGVDSADNIFILWSENRMLITLVTFWYFGPPLNQSESTNICTWKSASSETNGKRTTSSGHHRARRTRISKTKFKLQIIPKYPIIRSPKIARVSSHQSI